MEKGAHCEGDSGFISAMVNLRNGNNVGASETKQTESVVTGAWLRGSTENTLSAYFLLS